jgi:hypothetical protein
MGPWAATVTEHWARTLPRLSRSESLSGGPGRRPGAAAAFTVRLFRRGDRGRGREEQFHCFDAVTVPSSLPLSMSGLSSQNDPTDMSTLNLIILRTSKMISYKQNSYWGSPFKIKGSRIWHLLDRTLARLQVAARLGAYRSKVQS